MSPKKGQAPSLPGLPTYSSSVSSSSSSESEPEDYKPKVNQGADATKKVTATQEVEPTHKVYAIQEVRPKQEIEPDQEAAAAPGAVGYTWPPPGSPTESDTDEPEPELDPLSDDIIWDSDEDPNEPDGKGERNDVEEPQNPGVETQTTTIVQQTTIERIEKTPSWAGSVYSFKTPAPSSTASSPLGPKSPTPPPPSPGPPANKPKEKGMPAGIAPRAGHQHAETGMEDDAPDAAVARAVAAAKKRKREEEAKTQRKAPPRKKTRFASPEKGDDDDDDESDAPSEPPVVETGKKPRKKKNNDNGKKEGAKPKPSKAPPKNPTKNKPKGGSGKKKDEGMEKKKCSGRTTKGEPCKNEKNVKEGDEYNCGKHKSDK